MRRTDVTLLKVTSTNQKLGKNKNNSRATSTLQLALSWRLETIPNKVTENLGPMAIISNSFAAKTRQCYKL